MIDLQTWGKAWSLLNSVDRRNAVAVLVIVIFAALLTAGMVGSIMPFLSVLSDASKIENVPALKWAYYGLGFESTYRFLVFLGLASLATIVVATFMQILRTYVVAEFAMMRVHSLSCRLLETYLKQPYEYFLGHHTGEMGTTILAESQQVVNYFFRPAATAVASFCSMLAILILLMWVDVVVTLACLTVLGIVYGATFLSSRRMLQRLGDLRLKSNKQRYRIATEALGGIKHLKLLGRERAYLDRFARPSREVARTEVVAAVVAEAPSYVVQATALAFIIVLCLMLIKPADLGNGTPLSDIIPLLGIFAFAGLRLIPELQRINMSLTQLQYGRAAVAALHQEIVGRSGAELPPREPPQPLGLSDRLEILGISYRYPTSEHGGISDISFSITAGEKIGVVGSTGAGKSTLADLLLGLIKPTSGTIRVDGHALSEENFRRWQQTIGYVPQDIFLIDASIAENIALGLAPDDIDLPRVHEVSEIAKLSEFVEKDLPEKYKTFVGERGVRLSGGQRQRIGIARALYHDADFFVFDEATSALDNSTEQDVIESINALPGDKTILMIAHRLSTIKICDRILVLDQGRLVGIGTWQQLIESSSAFQRVTRLDQSQSPVGAVSPSCPADRPQGKSHS